MIIDREKLGDEMPGYVFVHYGSLHNAPNSNVQSFQAQVLALR